MTHHTAEGVAGPEDRVGYPPRYDDCERRVEGLTRDEACARYRHKVLLIARRVFERLPPDASTTVDDLASVGAMGLLEAFERFEAKRAIRFSTFAEYRIRGAMYDLLRDADVFSRRRRVLAKQIEEAFVTLRSELGRAPNANEIAERLHIDVAEYHAAVDRTSPITHVSLDARSHDDSDGSPMHERIAGNDVAPDRAMAAEDVRRALKRAIEALPERQRQCVLMYYATGLNLAEIAAVFKITPSRVSQILTEARGKLKERLENELDPEDLALEMPG